MKELASFAAAFCTVCVMTGGLYLICPQNKLQNAVKYVFSLIFLLCIVTSLPHFKEIKPLYKNTSGIVENEKANENVIKSIFETALKNSGIEFTEIQIFTDKVNDGSINIKKVTVFTDADETQVRTILGGDKAEYDIETVGN